MWIQCRKRGIFGIMVYNPREIKFHVISEASLCLSLIREYVDIKYPVFQQLQGEIRSNCCSDFDIIVCNILRVITLHLSMFVCLSNLMRSTFIDVVILFNL